MCRLHITLGARRTILFQSYRRPQRSEMKQRRLLKRLSNSPASSRTLKSERSKSELSHTLMHYSNKRLSNGSSLLTRYIRLTVKKCILTILFQPLQALEHPKFHEMIAVASRAPKGEGVNIPGRKATRSHIVKLFDTHMRDLRERLSVCVSRIHTYIYRA